MGPRVSRDDEIVISPSFAGHPRLGSRPRRRCRSWSSRTSRGFSRSSRAAWRRRGFAWTAAGDGPGRARAGARRARTTPSSSTFCCRASTGSRCCASFSAASPTLPVVIVSARSDLPTKLRGFGLGASDYLAKPFALDELVARVRVQLRTRDDPAATRASSARASSTLDLARRQARLGELVADLSDREFRAPAPPRRARGHDREPRAPAVGGLGLPLRPGLERRRRLRPAAAQEARRRGAHRDGSPCGLSASLRRRRVEARVGRVRRLRTSAPWSSWPSWETIPFHFIWVSLTLLYGFRIWRPPLTAAVLARRRARRRACSSCSDAFDGDAALGRAVRGAADVGDVPGDGLARPPASGRARARSSARPRSARRCSSSRSGSSTTSRTSCARR